MDRHFELARKRGNPTYTLRLYMTGFTPASTRAIANLKTLCEEHLNGRFDLEVVDIFQRPSLAKGEQILATPTLLKLLPVPMQRLLGELSGVGGKLFGLDLQRNHRRPPA